MNCWGYLGAAFIVAIPAIILYTWVQKFLFNRPDRYGKGPGHELRGPERGQWDRIPTRRKDRS